MNRRAFVAGFGAVTGVLAGCTSRTAIFGADTRTENRTYEAGTGTRLRVHNRDGPVTVEGHDGDDIAVDIEISGPTGDARSAVSVVDGRGEGELRLETEYDETFEEQEPSVELTIRCPQAVSVEGVKTVNGPVEAVDVAGDADLETRNGDLTARNDDGMVSLTTGDGRIAARNVGGVTGVGTASGSIEVDVPAVEDDVEIRTANGSIDAALAADMDAAVSASTANGSVELHDLELSPERTSRTSVSGSLGDGSHDLSIGAENGSIDLRSLSG